MTNEQGHRHHHRSRLARNSTSFFPARDWLFRIALVLPQRSIRTVTAFFFELKTQGQKLRGKKSGKENLSALAPEAARLASANAIPGKVPVVRVNIWVEEKVKCNITGSMMEIKWKLVLQQVVRSG